MSIPPLPGFWNGGDVTTLAEKYRPQTLEEVSGAEVVVSLLRTMIDSDSLPGCMMFTGPRGTGKTSATKILNREMNGDINDGSSFLQIDAASHNGVDDVRKIQEELMYAHSGNWRIVVLDEAHSLSSAAFNALLKILENPPERTAFILVTTKPDAIPDTVRSRAMAFRFPRLSTVDIARRLLFVNQQEGLGLDPRVVARVAQVSEGSMRIGLVLLQQLSLVENPTIETVNILSGYTVDFTDLLYALKSGKLYAVEVELSSIFHDSYDPEKLLVGLSATAKEFKDKGALTTEQFLMTMRAVWTMRDALKSSDTVARALLESAIYALFLQSFWDGNEEGAPVEDTTAVPLTAEDFANIGT